MGIYFNDRLLEPKEDGTEIEKKYYEERKEIDDLFEKENSVILIRDVKRQPDSKNQSFRAVVPFALPSSVPLYLDSMGAVEIRYSKAPPQRHGKEYVYPSLKLFMYERMILTKKNKDLAWFLLKATTFIEGGDSGSKKVIRIHDPEKNVLDKASEVRKIFEVDALLMNQESHIYNIESMRKIADRFGVDVKNFKVEAAAFTVREKLIDADNKKNPDFNIKAFLKYAKSLKVTKTVTTLAPTSYGEKVYTQDELTVLYPPELAVISDKLKTQKVPAVKKVEQITQILNAQKKLVEA